MWKVIGTLVSIFIVILFLTEFLIPLLTNKPMFNSFRKKDFSKKSQPPEEADKNDSN
jgi:hypothetical protein